MINIPFKYIKAADVFRDEKDVRLYCRGFMIKNECLITTNGHYLFIAPEIKSGGTALIFDFIGKIPTSADLVQIDFNELTATFLSEKKGTVAQMGVEIVNVPLYDYERVMDSYKPSPTEEIGFQHKYLNDLSKAGKALGMDTIKLELGGSIGATKIKLGDCVAYLMPCRV